MIRAAAMAARPDLAAEFRAVLEAAGLVPGEVVPDGTLRRCGTADKPRSTNGWYVLHLDPPAGAYGDWSTGLSETWSGNAGLSDEDRRRLHEEIERQRAERERTEAAARAEAIEKARRYRATLPPAAEATPYLKRKGVKPCPGMLADGEALVVPVLGEDGRPMSYQRIEADGSKRFAPGCPVADGWFAIRGDGGPLIVCEGVATGASLHEATGATVLCAFSAGNLAAVATMARTRYPDRRIILAADNDAATEAKTNKNPGVTAATEAARAVGGLLAVPDRAGDFNDLAAAEGIEAVREIIERAEPVATTATATADEWPEPVPFDSADAPAIPPEAVPPQLWEFCELCAKAIQAPTGLAVMATVGTLAAAAQGKFRVVVRDGYREPVNLYILACLSVAERKSAVLDACKRPLIDWETEQARFHGPEVRRLRSERATREKTIERVRSIAA